MTKFIFAFCLTSLFSVSAFAKEPKIAKLDCPKGTKQDVRWYGGIDTGPREIYCREIGTKDEVMEGQYAQFTERGLRIIDALYHDDKIVERTLYTYDRRGKLIKKVTEKKNMEQVVIEKIENGQTVKTITQKHKFGVVKDTSYHGAALD